MNGAGYLEPDHPGHIWIVEVPKTLGRTAKGQQITDGEFSEGDIVWSRDGSQIYFTSRRVREQYYELPHTDLYVVKATGGDITKVTGLEGNIGGMTLSPDGSRHGFRQARSMLDQMASNDPTANPIYSSPPCSRFHSQKSHHRLRLRHRGRHWRRSSSAARHGPSTPFWSKDGRFIFVTGAEEGRSNLNALMPKRAK